MPEPAADGLAEQRHRQRDAANDRAALAWVGGLAAVSLGPRNL